MSTVAVPLKVALAGCSQANRLELARRRAVLGNEHPLTEGQAPQWDAVERGAVGEGRLSCACHPSVLRCNRSWRQEARQPKNRRR